MPVRPLIFHDRRLIWVGTEGTLTDADLVDYVRDILGQDDHAAFDECFDLRGARELDLTYRGLSAVAEAAAASDSGEEPTKIALLVGGGLDFGLSRMYRSLRENEGGGREVRIFHEEGPLLGWLDLPPDWEVEG
jgi:hypothetical protein